MSEELRDKPESRREEGSKADIEEERREEDFGPERGIREITQLGLETIRGKRFGLVFEEESEVRVRH